MAEIAPAPRGRTGSFSSPSSSMEVPGLPPRLSFPGSAFFSEALPSVLSDSALPLVPPPNLPDPLQKKDLKGKLVILINHPQFTPSETVTTLPGSLTFRTLLEEFARSTIPPIDPSNLTVFDDLGSPLALNFPIAQIVITPQFGRSCTIQYQPFSSSQGAFCFSVYLSIFSSYNLNFST